MPRYVDDEETAPKKPRAPMKFFKPFVISESPRGFELRDANGILMAEIPATANPDAFPQALSIDDAKRVAVRLREKMNEEAPKPPESAAPEQDQRNYGRSQGTPERNGGQRGTRSRSSGYKGNGGYQGGGSRSKRVGAYS